MPDDTDFRPLQMPVRFDRVRDTQQHIKDASDPDHIGDSQKLLSYWNGMREGQDIPLRSQIDPRGIASLLSRTFILEEIAPGIARFRVAGSRVGEMLGMDVRGMPLSALFTPASRTDLASGLEALFDGPGILRAALISPGRFGCAALEAGILILPLRDDRGDVTRAMGCITLKGLLDKTPRRLGIKRLRVDPLSAIKPARAPDLNKARRHAPLPPLRLAPPKPGQPDYLRLVLTD